MKKWEDKIQEKVQNIWENHKVALLIAIIAIPLIIQIIFGIFNIISEIELWNIKFPDSSNWIGFWGSYLGIIPSGLIAYWVANYQINQDRKMSERALLMTKLPFFDINSDLLNLMSFPKDGTGNNTEIKMQTIEGKMPVRSVKVTGFDTNGQTHAIAYNYFYPSETKMWFIKLTGINDDVFGLTKVKLWCRLLDGTKVFYTWGNGTTEAHYFKTIGSDHWEPYVDGENIYFNFNKEEADEGFNQ